MDIFLYADDTAILFSADNDAELQAITDTFFSKYATWCTKLGTFQTTNLDRYACNWHMTVMFLYFLKQRIN